MDQDEECPEPDHDVVAVVEQLHVARPLGLREVVQPVDGAAERAIGQETEYAWHDNGVLQPSAGDIRLPDDGELRERTALEEPLHRGERDRLVPRHLFFPAPVPGRGRNQQAGHQSRR